MMAVQKQPIQRTNNQEKTPSESFDLLDILNDKHTINIIEQLSTDPQPICEMKQDIPSSKPTIYRRINKLKELGVVTEGTKISRDGHHKSTYVLNEFTLNIEINTEFDISVQ